MARPPRPECRPGPPWAAVERRDGDKTRYQGLGVLGAVDAVRGEITDRLRGQEWHDLAEIDAALIELDGTPNKHG